MRRTSSFGRVRRPARLRCCLLSLLLLAGALPPRLLAEEPFEDEQSQGVFSSYAAWAASEGGKAALGELEKRFWGDEETEAFVNKVIDWGNTKTVPKTNMKLGKVLFLADTEFKSKAAQQVAAFGSIEKIYGALEAVDRIAAGEWAEVMQEAAVSFLTDAATKAIPVLGQLKLAYDLAKLGWTAFMNEIYDSNVRRLYGIYSREMMDWETFKERYQEQLGYGDTPMDQFSIEFAAKNGIPGITKADFEAFKSGNWQARRTIDTLTRIVYNKFKEQRQKELQAAAQARVAKGALEEAAAMATVAKNLKDVQDAVKAELARRAQVEFEKQKAAAEKWAKWREKEKAMAAEEARARAAAGPAPKPVEVDFAFKGFTVPDAGKLVSTLDSVVARGAVPEGYLAPSCDGTADGDACTISRPMGSGAMSELMTQLRDLQEGYNKEFSKLKEELDKVEEEKRKVFEQRQDALFRAMTSCKEDANNRRASGNQDEESRRCEDAYQAGLASLQKSNAGAGDERRRRLESTPKLDFQPFARRFKYWADRYTIAQKAETAAGEALSALSLNIPNGALADVDYDAIESRAKPMIGNARTALQGSCANVSADFNYCAASLKEAAGTLLRAMPSTEDDGGAENAQKSLDDFSKDVAKAKAALPRAQSTCQRLFAATEGTAWAYESRGNCNAALASFDDKRKMAEDREKEWKEQVAATADLREKQTKAEALVAEFASELEAATPALENAMGVALFSGQGHPYDWLRQAGETGALAMTYLPGLDAKGLASVRGEVEGLLSGFSEWGQQNLSGPYTFLVNLKAFLKTVRPVPQGAVVLNDSVVTVRDVEDISASANLVDPASRHATGQVAALRNNLQSLIFSPQDVPEDHPVRAAYDDALKALENAEARIEKGSENRAKDMQKRGEALSAAVAKLKAAAEKGKGSAAELERLRKELEAFRKELDALSGKERDESRVDTQEIMQGLLDCEAAMKEASEDDARRQALDKLKDIAERVEAAAPSAVMALMEQAAKIASAAGIGGDPEVKEIMGRMSQAAYEKGASPGGKPGSEPPPADGPVLPPPGAPLAPPLGGGKPDPRNKPTPQAAPGEVERILADALDDMKDLKASILSAPPGPAYESQLQDAADRARELIEKANGDLQEKGVTGLIQKLQPLHALRKEIETLAKGGAGGPGSAAPGAADPKAMEQIRQLYQKFSAAFANKDLPAVLDLLAEDWESSEGVTVMDMERTLNNSFSVFDSVQMTVQNLQIMPKAGGTYMAVYSTKLTGTIRANDIQHEETSTHQDTIVMTPQGPKISRTSGTTAWVQ